MKIIKALGDKLNIIHLGNKLFFYMNILWYINLIFINFLKQLTTQPKFAQDIKVALDLLLKMPKLLAIQHKCSLAH